MVRFDRIKLNFEINDSVNNLIKKCLYYWRISFDASKLLSLYDN